MAANDYYNTGYSSQQQPWKPENHTQQTSWAHGSPPTSPQPYPNPYDHRHSQYSEHDIAGAGGKYHNNDAYAEDIPLRPNAAQPGKPDWVDSDTQYPPAPDTQAALGPSPSNPRRRRKKKGFFSGKIPFVTYLFSIIQIAVFIAEIVKNAKETGSPIMIKPQFNPMIGPSPYVQVNMGARFVACMRNTKGVHDAKEKLKLPCPSTTSADPKDYKCTLSELCGLSGVPPVKVPGSLDDKPAPNQWYRFITPIFLHAGLIHIAMNMFVQLTMGADMERDIGWWRYAIIYLASGIFGFVLGGNFAAPGIASTGASGSLFGIVALCLLDLCYKWKNRYQPMKELIILIATIIISFVLGLLPGLDNFSHIGGFLTGITVGISLIRSPDALRERIGATDTPYTSMGEGAQHFVKKPLGFFKGRKPLWWAWWLVRAGALVGIIVAFIVLLDNFYKNRSTCEWCKYLSCLPVHNWCDMGKITTEKKQE